MPTGAHASAAVAAAAAAAAADRAHLAISAAPGFMLRAESVHPTGRTGSFGFLPPPRVEFVVLCHAVDAVSAAGHVDFTELSRGRVDMAARCISAATFVDHGVRSDVRLWLLFVAVGRTVEIRVGELRGMRPDEQRCAKALRDALLHVPAPFEVVPEGKYVKLARWAEGQRRMGALEPVSGFYVYDDDSLESRMASITSSHPSPHSPRVVLLRIGENGLSDVLAGSGPSAPTIFVLGDNHGLMPDEEHTVLQCPRSSAATIPGLSLLASHCIVLALHYVDCAQGVVHSATDTARDRADYIHEDGESDSPSETQEGLSLR
ncbi:hypothetical protein T492DRAFT_914678 [Pavlovales sp. CCMP2436]|nr:hypothetical protein T492DRAFT_914678 [Pavlovales sp. CCMP2436]